MLTTGRVLIVCGAFAVVFGLLQLVQNTSVVRLPSLEQQGSGITIMDIRDQAVCTVQKDRSVKPVRLSEISINMRHAIIAAEDRNFYKHPGIDFVGIGRALQANFKAGHIVEGGSTITQQLIKQLYLDPDDRSIMRKLAEAAMSIDVERTHSKDKILETYLNEIYFGRGAYGIEQAAQVYFNKSASRLNVAESAFLAGLVQAPSDLAAVKNRKRARVRQAQVLDDMVECGYIDRKTADAAKAQQLRFSSGRHPMKYPHYVSHVMTLVEKDLGKLQMWATPIKVYTYLDQSAQAAAEATLTRGVRVAPQGVQQGALVSMNISDGAVIAMVGGVGAFEQASWNRAVYPHTAGSAFKPFVYLAGLISGAIGPDTILDDSPLAVLDNQTGHVYTPKNFDGGHMGLLTVRDALALSRNVCAVEVANKAGLGTVIETARAAGITSKMESYPSLALGACAVSPLEMAAAYATLARSGVHVEPRFIRKIETAGGFLLKDYKPKVEKKLPSEPVNQLVDVMLDVVSRGTGKRARLPGVQVAGKTGTADQAKDVWFIGFTPDVATAVWAGNDQNKPIPGSHVTGGSVVAGIWRDYMARYYQDHRQSALAFTPPRVPLGTQVYGGWPWTAFGFSDGYGVRTYGQLGKQLGKQVEKEVDEALTEVEEEFEHEEKKPSRGIVRKFVGMLKKLF